MYVINLFGQPGAGKSTGAAYIFSQLKLRCINAELVTEFAKDKVYEETKEVFNNQIYIFGKQYFRMSRIKDKVDVIITDSPLLLSSFYTNGESYDKELNDLVLKVFNSFNNFNFFIKRTKEYNPSGRFQTEDESDKIAIQMQDFLRDRNIPYKVETGDIEGYNNILKLLEV